MPVTDFMVGVKRTALEPGEMIVSVTLPLVQGWQGYAKVGVRNAMVIAVASACVVLDRADRRVGVALGSVGPTIPRCPIAETHLAVGDGLVDTSTWGRATSADSVNSWPPRVARSRTIVRRRSIDAMRSAYSRGVSSDGLRRPR